MVGKSTRLEIAIIGVDGLIHLDLSSLYIEDITWPRGDTKFLDSSVEKYFTSERSERVKYFSTRT